MTEETIKVLLVDDEEEIRAVFVRMLSGSEWETTAVGSVSAAREQLAVRQFDVVVTDLAMPGARGEELAAHTRGLENPPAVVVITGYPSYESVVEMLRLQVFDYIEKPFDNMEKVRLVVRNAAQARRLKLENERLMRELEEKNRLLSRKTEDLGERVEDYQVALQEKVRRLEESRDVISAQQQRLLAILDGLGEGVLVTDDEGQVMLINRAAQRMLQTEAHQILGRDVAGLRGKAGLRDVVVGSVNACRANRQSQPETSHAAAGGARVRVKTSRVRGDNANSTWVTTLTRHQKTGEMQEETGDDSDTSVETRILGEERSRT